MPVTYPSDIAVKRNQFIEDNERRFERIIRSLQGETWAEVEREVFDNLDLNEDGTIKNTAKNLSRMSAFKRIAKELQGGPRADMIKWLLDQLEEQFNLARGYFRKMMGVKSLGVDDAIKSRWRAQYGVNRKGFVTRGVLYDLWQDNSDILKIQKNVSKGIMTGTSLTGLIRKTRDFVLGTSDRDGVVTRTIREQTLDVFPNNDTGVSKQYADALEFNFAIYNGGLMDSSRPFCIRNNGKIFHRTEIEAWEQMTWKGKSDPYDPYIDIGGYNCKHTLDWISDELAANMGKNVAAFPR